MKRSISLALAAVLAMAAPAAGQSIYVMVGPSFPIGDYGDYAGTGFHLAGGFSLDLVADLSVYAEGFWGQNNHSDSDAKTRPYGAYSGLLYEFETDALPVDPYIFGGIGILVHDFSFESGGIDLSESENAFSYQTGAGVEFDLGGLDAFGEVRLLGASFDAETQGLDDEATTFIAVTFGVSFDLGGGDDGN